MTSSSGQWLKHVTLLILLAAGTVPASCATSDPFYIIAHMANSAKSLDWSVAQGANGIENDIQFDGSGNPYLFEHRGICDCSCPYPPSYHICLGGLGNSCSGSSANDNGANHLRHIARLSQVALVVMDSKVDAKWGTRLRTAGRNIVSFLEENLFGYGYKGKVVVSAGKINCYDYVMSAAEAAASTSHRDRYFFSFDQEGDNYGDVAAMLSRFTKNRVFGTGISSCAPGSYTSGIGKAVVGVRQGQVGMSYIWTLDKESSMNSYIDIGVHGIITNRPALLKRVAASKGLRIARPGDSIPTSWNNVPSPKKCDCDYHKGGCTISFPAPPGMACRCSYRGFWTCKGYLRGCNWGNSKCSNPDASKEACKLGGGDCDAY